MLFETRHGQGSNASIFSSARAGKLIFFSIDQLQSVILTLHATQNPKNAVAIVMLSLLDSNNSKDDSLSASERKALLKSANSKLAKAYQLDPKNSLCCTQLALKMIEREESNKAIVMASSALMHTRNPLLKANAFLTKGRIAHAQVISFLLNYFNTLSLKKGIFQGAYDNYKLAADNDPNSPVIQFYLALSLIEKGSSFLSLTI